MTETAPSESRDEVVVLDQQTAMVRGAAPGDVVEAVEEYRKIQKALDDAMPDCLMTIQKRKFRKKNYWRAIATAFNLTVTLTSEERVDVPDDWGWLVIYTAAASNGRSADGDGTCFATEKWSDRQRCPACGEGEFSFRSKNEDGPSHFCWKSKGGCGHEWTPAADTEIVIDKSQATVHNVRAHAHTRAYNRAVSNLVGFGEVSAEEMQQEQRQEQPQGRGAAPRASGARTISEPQKKRLYAKGNATAKRLNVPAEQVDEYAKAWMRERGFQSSMDLTREPYDQLCETLDGLTLTHLAVPPVREEEPPPAGTNEAPPPEDLFA